jgi:hypothetical protein
MPSLLRSRKKVCARVCSLSRYMRTVHSRKMVAVTQVYFRVRVVRIFIIVCLLV